jgi:hypothetical protein
VAELEAYQPRFVGDRVDAPRGLKYLGETRQRMQGGIVDLRASTRVEGAFAGSRGIVVVETKVRRAVRTELGPAIRVWAAPEVESPQHGPNRQLANLRIDFRQLSETWRLPEFRHRRWRAK